MNWMQAQIQDGATCHQLFPCGGGMSQLLLCIDFYFITFLQVFSRYVWIFCNFSFISKCQWNVATCVSFSGISTFFQGSSVHCTST